MMKLKRQNNHFSRNQAFPSFFGDHFPGFFVVFVVRLSTKENHP